jgi:prolyl oligopeptidase
VLFIQQGQNGSPDVLIDPNAWSTDGTVRLSAFAPSRDAKYAVYGISQSGSDWLEFKVMELATKRVLDDSVVWVKVSDIAWHGDGFFYSRYPQPPAGAEIASINEDHRVYFHALGTPQSADELVYADAANPQRFHTVSTTEDERYAVLSISDRGKGKDGNAIYVRDLAADEREFRPVVEEISNSTFSVLDNVGDALLVATNHKAPNWRVVRIDPKSPAEANWVDVLPERPEPLESAQTAGGKLFATYLKDVTTRAYVYDLSGKLENEIALPGLGAASGFGGPHDATFVF